MEGHLPLPHSGEPARRGHDDDSTEEGKDTSNTGNEPEGSSKNSWTSDGSEENTPRAIKLRTHVRTPKKCSDEKRSGAALTHTSSKS